MGTSLRDQRRHRSWPEELKREIVAASLEPGSSVSVVARRYDVNANQVFAWRKRYREPVSTAAPLQLVPVTVTPDRQCEPSPASTSGLIDTLFKVDRSIDGKSAEERRTVRQERSKPLVKGRK